MTLYSANVRVNLMKYLFCAFVDKGCFSCGEAVKNFILEEEKRWCDQCVDKN